MSGCLGRKRVVMSDLKGCELKNMSAQARAHALWFAAKERREQDNLVVTSDINEKISAIVDIEECLVGVCKTLITRVQNLEEMLKITHHEILLMKIQSKGV